MTILQRIDDLNEDALDEFILAEESGFPYDRVKVASAEIVYVEDELVLLELAMEGEHVWVGRNTSMEPFLASMIILGALLLDTLDGVVHAGADVKSAVNNTICPFAQD